ncbi:MAG: hypothetical protein V1645_04795 [archaeon]
MFLFNTTKDINIKEQTKAMTTISEKRLRDGTTLRLEMWVSDSVKPGEMLYRLELEIGRGMKKSYPTNLEDCTMENVTPLYDKIESENDFASYIKAKKEPSINEQHRRTGNY